MMAYCICHSVLLASTSNNAVAASEKENPGDTLPPPIPGVVTERRPLVGAQSKCPRERSGDAKDGLIYFLVIQSIMNIIYRAHCDATAHHIPFWAWSSGLLLELLYSIRQRIFPSPRPSQVDTEGDVGMCVSVSVFAAFHLPTRRPPLGIGCQA